MESLLLVVKKGFKIFMSISLKEVLVKEKGLAFVT